MKQEKVISFFKGFSKFTENYLINAFSDKKKIIDIDKIKNSKQNKDYKIPLNGHEDVDEYFSDLKMFAGSSLNTLSPGFLNQLYSSSNIPALIGDMLTPLFNTSMATFEIAPMATLVELEIVDTLKRYIGFDEGEGIMLTGGSNANLVALLAARNLYYPETKDEGSTGDLACFISDQAHYSFSKAVNILGIGRNNLIKVKSDEHGRLNIEDLENKINLSIEHGKKPFFVCATSGTTVRGAFDPIEEISTICKKYDLWLHVDGAWGGSVAISQEHKKLISGVEFADSFTWDAHKLMNIPLICSFIFFKEKGILEKSHSGGGAEYIFHENENMDYDLGRISLQCGRRIDSLKFWLALRYYGINGFSTQLNKYFSLRDYFLEKIKSLESIELVYEPEFLNICFRVMHNGENISLIVRDKLFKKGTILVNYSWDDNKEPFLRLVINNVHSDTNTLDELISQLTANS